MPDTLIHSFKTAESGFELLLSVCEFFKILARMRRPACRTVLMVATLPGILSCTTTSDVVGIDQSVREDYVPLDEEIWAVKQADLIHDEFSRQGLIYGSPAKQSYADYLEGRLLSGRENLQEIIQIHFLKSPLPNAISLPNGDIFIFSGLFAAVESEDQLAAIVCHEIAHVTERHSLKAVIARKNTVISANIADLLTGGLGIVYLGAAANLMHFSRAQETEADAVGVAMLARAGYSPQATLEVFESMSRFPELKHVKTSIYSSHPSFETRLNDLRQVVKSQSSSSLERPERRSEQFESLKSSMMEDSIQMRLRMRQYSLALNLIGLASENFSDTAKLEYLRGEVYRGFYRYPNDAAQELHWIETGKTGKDRKLLARFERQRDDNLKIAVGHYLAAVEKAPPYARAYKRLGELMENTGRVEEAVTYFNLYLSTDPGPGERMAVESALEQLKER